MKLHQLLLLLTFATFVHAIYEDQLGTSDWQKQFVGQVLNAHLHRSKPRLYLGTKEGVVGSLNLRDGSIAWRRILADQESLDGVVLLDKPSVVVSLSHKGKYLRSWDQNDGFLRWEVAAYASASPNSRPSLATVTFSSGVSAIVVVVNGYLQLYEPHEGQLRWKVKLQAAEADTVTITAINNNIAVVGTTPGSSTVSLAVVSALDGKPQTEIQVALPPAITAGQVAFTTQNIAVLSEDRKYVCAAGTTSAAESANAEGVSYTSFKCHTICEVLEGVSPSAGLQLIPAGAAIILSPQDTGARGVGLLRFSEAGDVAAANVFPESGFATNALDVNDEVAVGLLGRHGATGLAVKVVDVASGEVLHEEQISSLAQEAAGGQPATLARAFLGTFKKRDQTDGFRVLLTWSDAALMLVQQGQVVWNREEALASVTAAQFADLPAVRHAAAASEQNITFNDHVKVQLLSIKVQFKMDTPEEVAELADLRQRLSAKNRPFRDANGFRKLIILLTRVGKLLALHSGDGRVVWSHNLPLPAGASSVKLLHWRSFHDTQHAPQLLLLAYGGPSTTGLVVDAHSGELLEQLDVPFATSKVTPLHRPLHGGKSEQTLLMLISDASTGGSRVRLLPDSPASRDTFTAQSPTLNFWTHDAATNCLVGYGFATGALDTASGVATPVETWRLRFAPGEEVLALAARDPAEPIHSYVKILGDRSLMYKYLNPNTLFVASGPGDAALQAEGPEKPGSRRVTATLLDTVTGRLLHRQTHHAARGPVQAVFSENWVVYQYFNTHSSRFEVVVSEMYDAKHRPFSMMDAMLSDTVSHETLSSFQPAEVDVLTQLYYSRLPIRSIAVTHTAKGLTPKEVLFATYSDQVYSIPKRILDPRRPRRAKLTREEMEEGLMPYQEELGVVPQLFVSLNKQIAKVSTVLTAPTGLESATHMFASGVDLFYNRLQPAKAFDSLEDDFSYGLLLLAMVALVIGAGLLHYTSAKSQLNQKWK